MVLFLLKEKNIYIYIIQLLFSLSTENSSLLFYSFSHACFEDILELLFHNLVFPIISF